MILGENRKVDGNRWMRIEIPWTLVQRSTLVSKTFIPPDFVKAISSNDRVAVQFKLPSHRPRRLKSHSLQCRPSRVLVLAVEDASILRHRSN